MCSADNLAQRRKARQGLRTENSKHEIRNPKQYQMIKIQKIPNEPVSDFVIGISVSRLFRISIFGFRISIRGLSASWRGDPYPVKLFKEFKWLNSLNGAQRLNGLNVLNLHYVACIKIDTGDSKITTPLAVLIIPARFTAANSAAITTPFITPPISAGLASDVL